MANKIAFRTGLPLVLTLGALVVLTGCPIQSPPPFDASGTYTGVYGLDDPQFTGADNCGMTLDIYHNPGAPRLKSTFTGVAQLNWDCLLGPQFQDLLGIQEETVKLPLLAVLHADGSYRFDLKLSIADIPEQLAQYLDESELDLDLANTFEAFEVSFTGVGADADGDGFMDESEGSLSVFHQFRNTEGELITLDTSGTFAVSAIIPVG